MTYSLSIPVSTPHCAATLFVVAQLLNHEHPEIGSTEDDVDEFWVKLVPEALTNILCVVASATYQGFSLRESDLGSDEWKKLNLWAQGMVKAIEEKRTTE